jgi:hypothetical protein
MNKGQLNSVLMTWTCNRKNKKIKVLKMICTNRQGITWLCISGDFTTQDVKLDFWNGNKMLTTRSIENGWFKSFMSMEDVTSFTLSKLLSKTGHTKQKSKRQKLRSDKAKLVLRSNCTKMSSNSDLSKTRNFN